MSDDLVALRKERDAVEIVLASPPVNRFTVEFLEQLGAALRTAAESSTAVLIRSDVDGVFAAGGDLEYMAAAGPEESDEYVALCQEVYGLCEQPGLVTVAAIDGYCLAGGLELALACDIRLAKPKAVLGLPEVRLGILPAGGAIHRLVRAVGQGVARDMLLTGLRISGVEAHRWGLVSRLVEDDLAEEARSLTRTLENGAHQATSATKFLALQASNEDMTTGLGAESSAWSKVRASGNAQEGLSAFLEKRAPQFSRRRS